MRDRPSLLIVLLCLLVAFAAACGGSTDDVRIEPVRTTVPAATVPVAWDASEGLVL